MPEPSITTEPQVRKRPVAIDRVESLPETRDVRCIDREHVEMLALAVDHLPPIDVVKLAKLNAERFGILAGYHRLAAHQLAGKKAIRIVVHDLAVEEWHPFAVRSNLAHGLPLTLDQRKAAARRMLEDNPRSSRAIAKDCGLSDKTVEALRRPEADDEATADFPQLRVGQDGKSRRMPISRNEDDAAFDPVHAGMLEEEPELPFMANDREEALSYARKLNALIGLENACDLIDRLTVTLSDDDVLTLAPQAGGRLRDPCQIPLLISLLHRLAEEFPFANEAVE